MYMTDVERFDMARQEARERVLAALAEARRAGDEIIARALGQQLNALRIASDLDAVERIGERVLRLHGCLWHQIACALRDPSLL